MWPVKTILWFVMFWVGCVLSLMNPIYGVVNYMMIYQINPNDTWWGAPLKNIGMRMSFLAAICTLIGMLISRKKVPRVSPWISVWEMGALLLVAIAGITAVTGVQTTDMTLYMFEKLWKVVLFVLVITRLASTRANLRLMLWTLVIGSFYLGWTAYTAPTRSFVMGRLDKIGGPDFSTTSGAAAHLVAMLPLIGAVFLTTTQWRWKALAAMSGALCVNAVIMCRTRSAFIGIACGVVAALLVAPRVRRSKIYTLMILGAVASFALTDDHFWTRMATLASAEKLNEDMAAVSRREIWHASIRIFADHPFGIGPGNFPAVIGDYAPAHYKRATHNSLVACFVELGIQGGIVFLSMCLGSLALLLRSHRTAHLSANPVETKILAYGFFISFVTYTITALGTQRLYCESFWWVLAMPLCLNRVVRREAAAEQEMPVPLLAQHGCPESFAQSTPWEALHGPIPH